jgi:hypothetical protein
MTSLFLEYESSRKVKENSKSLLGKKFYWSMNGKLDYRPSNEIVVTSIDKDSYYNKTFVTYRYSDGLSGSLELNKFLNEASPMDT